jgi:hypothetical protein
MAGRLRHLVILFAATLLAFCLHADGLPIKDGRYAGGPVILIRLTSSQVSQIQRHYIPWMKLDLTSDQRKALKQKSSLVDPPTKVNVLLPKDSQDECTCGASNIALVYQPGWIELPIKFLCSDKQAEEGLIGD